MFFTLFGCWAPGGEGVSQEIGTQPVMLFFTLGSSKMEVFETFFLIL